MFFKKKPDEKIAADKKFDENFAARVEASGLFDPVWYVRKHPEVAQFKAGPLEHFCQYGIFEHRDPGPNFDTARYLAANLDVPDAQRAPFAHALSRIGTDAERPAWLADDVETFVYLVETSGLFEEKYYLAKNHDVVRSKLDPLDHFIRYGAAEGRDPSPHFETDHYKSSYPEYLNFARGPIDHYLRVGRRKGNKPKGPGEYHRWIDAFDVLTASDHDRIAAFSDSVDVSRLTCIQVLDAEGCRRLGPIIDAFAGQIGGLPRLRLLRGASIRDASWASAVADHSSRAEVAFFDHAGDVARDLVDGDRVLLCAGASILRPHACAMFASALMAGETAAAYADHDHLDDAGARTAPVLKPAMSPEFLRATAYAGSVIGIGVTSAILPALVAGLSRGADVERAWSDLLLGCDPGRVAHIPLILSHVFSSPAVGDREYYEPVPGLPQPEARERPAARAGAALPSVRIVIPTRDRVDLLRDCIDSIRSKTDYPAGSYEIVVVDNESEAPESLRYLAEIQGQPGIAVVSAPGPFNFAAICNLGATGTNADILIFLNNDMTVIRADWIRKLVSHASRPDIGVVGARLLFPDDTVQHGGVVLGVQGVGAHRLIGVDESDARILDATREMTVVTGACLALRTQLFIELGGFDPILKVAFNDVKLGLDAHRAGYRNLYIGEALLYHHESKSRGYDTSLEKQNRNNREAIFVKERYGAEFQDDPSYNPSLSFQQVGKLAFPPRNVRPWRLGRGGRPRVLLLSCVHGFGHGVAMVVAEQAAFLRSRGWEVLIGGPETDHDIDYPGCERFVFSNAEAAASTAMAEGVDCIFVHTPPFFTVTLYLGARPFVYVIDHGEPPPHLFPDAEIRRRIDWEKRLCAPLAKRVFTISRTIHDQQFRKDAVVIRNGNSHLSVWSDDWRARRADLRKQLGFDGRFVVLNVSRFGESDRYYKGVDQYMELAREANFHGDRAVDDILFLHAGRGRPEDVAHVESAGIRVFSNISDTEMAELYASVDLFVSLSKWEGYNLGIGQACAMGLPVIASDIEAHREFGVETTNNLPVLLALLDKHHREWSEADPVRRPVVDHWTVPLGQLADVVEADLERAGSAPWFRFLGGPARGRSRIA